MLRRYLQPEYLFNPAAIRRRLLLEPPAESGSVWVKTARGFALEVDLSEQVGRRLWLLGSFEIVVAESLLRCLRPGDTAVDGGANVGYMTCLMAQACGPNGEVHAFEPHPRILERLRRNIAALPQPRADVVVHARALSRHSGSAVLQEPEGFAENQGRAFLGSNGSGGLDVETTTLDEHFPATRVQLLKLDVEGHELEVLEGARSLLQERRLTTVIFEAHQSVLRDEICQFLAGFGLESFALVPGFWRPHPRAVGGVDAFPSWEPPNFVASLEPEHLCRVLSRRGWQCLRSAPTS